MELNVDAIVSEDCQQFSASRAEGFEAKETWGNAQAYARENPLVQGEEQLGEARDFLNGFGCWNATEMPDVDVNALLTQFIAGDVREMQRFGTYEEYQQASEEGRVSGSLYKGDDGHWYYYVGC